jgi:L-ascorbate metabolism protein UlaG (beta-lactamase superfamily)
MKSGIELISEINHCTVEAGKIAFWWLGQLGYAVKSGNTVIYLDLFISPMPERNVPPLLKPQEVVNADYIFGSHDHPDHIDRDVWKQLSESSPGAKFVVPEFLIHELSISLGIPKNRFVGITDGSNFSEKGLKVTGIAAAHEFLDKDPQTGLYPYLGFIIEINGRVIFHSGDTCKYEGLETKLKAIKHIDLMFIPINGRDARRLRSNCIGNMTYQEAVDLAGEVKPGLAVPGHYEMFSFNSENPALFADYLDAKYPDVKCWIGGHGEMVIV